MSDYPSDAASALADLIAAKSDSTTPHALGCTLLREDPHAAALRAGEISNLVEAALVDGAALAEQIKQQWGDDPDRIAALNAVPVEDSESDAGYGTTIVYAEYRTRPPGIVLYRPAVDTLDRRLRQSCLGRLFGIENTRAVFLAHELYHHFDEARAQTLCSLHRVSVLRLGRLRVTAAVAGMREIAAGAFAQHVLGLRFHPRLLDVAAVLWQRPELSARMLMD